MCVRVCVYTHTHTHTHTHMCIYTIRGFPSGSEIKNLPANAGDVGSTLGLGRSPGEENRNPLQYSCLENPMDRGAWWAKVCGVMKDLDMT